MSIMVYPLVPQINSKKEQHHAGCKQFTHLDFPILRIHSLVDYRIESTAGDSLQGP